MSSAGDRTTGEEQFTKRLDLAVWRSVFSVAARYRVALGALIFVAITTAAGEALFTLMTRHVVDDVVANGMDASFGRHMVLFACLCITFCVCIWGFISLAGHISTRLAHDIRAAGFRRLQELSFSFYDQRSVGWLVARMTSDCDRLARFVSWGCLDVVWGTFTLLGFSIVMLVLDWKLALVVLTMVPPMIAVSIYFQKRLLTTSREVRSRNSDITASFGEAIDGEKTTKVYVRETENLKEFTGLTGRMYESSVLNAILGSVFMPLVIVISSLGSGLALWLGGVDVLRALPDSMSVGTLLAFISYAGQFRMPVQQLARVFTELQTAQAAAERTMGLIDTEPEIRDSAQVRTTIENTPDEPPAGLAIDGSPDRIDSLEFRSVSFAYGDGDPVLTGFDLTVKAGQTIALVGPTGGGKTTIASLACRFYEPTLGSIQVNGQDYRERSLTWLQSNLGVVLQQPHLFSGTVYDNIRYGRLGASEEDVHAAARAVNADRFIRELDHGYQTEVGEGGIMLSTGQKQLVSFARAIVADPRILVMDEATSSVDTETEVNIQKALARVLKGRISFVIAHRLSTIRSADRILFIEDGCIMEQGTHHELMRQRGKYHALYTEQFVEQGHDLILHDMGEASPRPRT